MSWKTRIQYIWICTWSFFFIRKEGWYIWGMMMGSILVVASLIALVIELLNHKKEPEKRYLITNRGKIEIYEQETIK